MFYPWNCIGSTHPSSTFSVTYFTNFYKKFFTATDTFNEKKPQVKLQIDGYCHLKNNIQAFATNINPNIKNSIEQVARGKHVARVRYNWLKPQKVNCGNMTQPHRGYKLRLHWTTIQKIQLNFMTDWKCFMASKCCMVDWQKCLKFLFWQNLFFKK